MSISRTIRGDDQQRSYSAAIRHCGLQVNLAGLLEWSRMICLAFKKGTGLRRTFLV